MRNLKRALSLTLASVMLLGMMVVGTSAASFPDVDEENSVEAIEVLSAVGVLQGYDDGQYHPETPVTRNQMAAIICRLKGLDTNIGVTNLPFPDVPAWAAGYVGACYNEGIINGRDNGMFDGDATVTATEAASMMLRALGYDRMPVGGEWARAVTQKASEIELFDSIRVSSNTAMVRNDIAQLALNTLKSTMVTSENGSTVTIGDISVTNDVKYNDRLGTAAKYKAFNDDPVDGKYTLELGEDTFDGKLKKSSDTDEFGRPGTKWTYKGDDVNVYADEADKSMILNKNLNADKVLVTDSDYFDYDDEDVSAKVTVWVNGTKAAEKKADLASLNLKAGDEIEVYENDDGVVTTVAVTRYQLARIKDVETNLSSTYTNKGASCSITLEDLSEAGIGGTYYNRYDGDSSKELAGYNSAYTEDTVLAVAVKSDNTILASHVAQPVYGIITKYDKGSKANITLDGTVRYLNATVNTETGDVAYQSLNLNYGDDEYTAYLDRNNYVLGLEVRDGVKIEDVYYVTGVSRNMSSYPVFYAQAVSLADGTVTEFKLKDNAECAKALDVAAAVSASTMTKLLDLDTNDGNWTTHGNFKSIQALFTFEKDGSNYIAKRYTTASDSTYYVYSDAGNTNAAVAVALGAGKDLKKDDKSMTVGTQKVYLNNNTNYIKVEADKADLSVKTAVGGTSVKAQNGSSQNTKAIAVTTKSGNNYVANYVVLVSPDFDTASSDDLVYVRKNYDARIAYTDADGKTKTGREVQLYFLDGSGKIETVTVAGNSDVSGVKSDGTTKGEYYNWVINDDGVYELSNKGTAANALTLSADYDDETGYLSNHTLTNIWNNALTVAAVSGHAVNDVDFADNVIIRDDRGEDVRKADLYSSEVTSVSLLDAALRKSGNTVKADVYFDDGKVIMVYVRSMTPDPNYTDKDITTDPEEPDEPGETGEYATGVNKDAINAASLKLSTATIAADGKLTLNVVDGISVAEQAKAALTAKGYTSITNKTNDGSTLTFGTKDSEGFDRDITVKYAGGSETITKWYPVTVNGGETPVAYIKDDTNATNVVVAKPTTNPGSGVLIGTAYQDYAADNKYTVPVGSAAVDIKTGQRQLTVTVDDSELAAAFDTFEYAVGSGDFSSTAPAALKNGDVLKVRMTAKGAVALNGSTTNATLDTGAKATSVTVSYATTTNSGTFAEGASNVWTAGADSDALANDDGTITITYQALAVADSKITITLNWTDKTGT